MGLFDKILNPFGNDVKVTDNRKSLSELGKNPHEYKDLSKESQKVTPLPPSDLLLYCRNIAGSKIQTHMLILNNCKWIRAEYTYPAFDSMNFIYKSSVFSVIIDIIDEEGVSYLPEEFVKRQLYAAKTYNLIPCKFPVVVPNPHEPVAEEIRPQTDDWNLFHTVTGDAIIPEQDAVNDPVELSDWELHNIALHFVINFLRAKKLKVLSWQDTLEVDPQLWFENTNGEKCWLLVRSSREKGDVPKPEKMNEIVRRCFKNDGFFAGLNLEPKKEGEKILRGGDLKITFNGFEKIHSAM